MPNDSIDNFINYMNNACRGQNGVFADMKNPYNSSEIKCYRLFISYTNDNDVLIVNWSTKSAI